MAALAQAVQTETSLSQNIVERVRITGTVRSPQSSNISTAVSGLVVTAQVDAGARVQRNDTLLQLDVEQEELLLQRTRAEQDQVAVELANAERRLAEAERLGKQADIAETEIDNRRAEVARLNAALQAARTEVARQQAVIRRHTIRAPFAGVVTSRMVELGEWVNPGDTLFGLIATDPLWFDFQISQSVYPKVSADSRMGLVVDANPNDILEGRIISIVPVKDTATRTFLLRAVAPTASGKPITPGMSVRGNLYLETGRRGVTVSRDALLRYPDGRTTVWTVSEADEGIVATEQLVKIGLEFDGRVEILSGLDAGIAVISRGNESLRPGQRISVM
jgi:RND family efflux transporter MFP subunit